MDDMEEVRAGALSFQQHGVCILLVKHSRSRDHVAEIIFLGWLIQECPAFIIPAFLIWRADRPDLLANPVHQAMLGMFMFHYFYRSFIYPFFLKGKPAPLATILSAVAFCTLNGYLQGMLATIMHICGY